MPRLVILRGVSGSGKSTWARSQSGFVVVSRDAIRLMQFGSDGPDYYKVDKDVLRERENVVTVIQNGMISAALKAGRNVIVDNTNTEWKFVKEIAKIGYRHGAEIEVKVFDVQLERAIIRDKQRSLAGGRYVGEAIIRKQHSRLQGTKDRTLEPAFVPTPYHGTPGRPKAFLFDLDGTVYHMGDKRGPYDHNVDVDDPDEKIIHIVRTMARELIPIAMSGRVTATRETTIKCLMRDNVPFEHLFMRADGDFRPDNIIKAELFDNHVRDNFDVQFVLDDRNQVVDMWRKMEMTCLQVAEGDF